MRRVDYKDEADQVESLAFLQACGSGDLSAVQLALETGFNNLSFQSKDGHFALYVAAYYGHAEIVDLLLDQPSLEVNQTLSSGSSALHAACQTHHAQVVEILLSHPGIAVNLVRASDQISPLGLACLKEDLCVMQALQRHIELDLNISHEFGYTALHIACRVGHADLVETLIHDPRIDMNLRTSDGDTPLMIASYYGHSAVVGQLVMDVRVQLDLLNCAGKTALMMASDRTSLACTHILLDAGANALILNRKGESVLTIAAEYSPEIAECLERHVREFPLGVGEISIERNEIAVRVPDFIEPRPQTLIDRLLLAADADSLTKLDVGNPSKYPGRLDATPMVVLEDLKSITLTDNSLGVGGFGAVCEGKSAIFGSVAVKFLGAAHITSEKAMEALAQEARLMFSFNHPNVVKVFAFCCQPTAVVMKRMSCSLRELINQVRSGETKLSFFQKLRIALGAACGLSVIHEARIAHRDLKPANVLLDKTDDGYHAVIADLGIAKQKLMPSADSSAEELGNAGTYLWQAPEVVNGGRVARRSDVYAFGSILGALFYGQFPYEEKVQELKSEGKDVRRMFVSGWIGSGIKPMTLPEGMLSGPVDQLIQDCWKGNYKDRPTSSEAFERLQIVRETLQPTSEEGAGIGAGAGAGAGAGGAAHLLENSGSTKEGMCEPGCVAFSASTD